MNPTLRNVLAIVVGLVVGSLVNMGIIMISSTLIPPPNGVDATSMEGLKENMHLFSPRHFLMPFLAHAIGTLCGAFIAAHIAATRKMTYALVIGIIFFCFGTINVLLLPAPVWFSITDLVLAYIPMAWLGGKLAIPSYKKE